MVHDDSHSTLRASADNNSRRAGSVAMAVLPNQWLGQDVNASTLAKNLKFSRHAAKNWDKLPIWSLQVRVYPNDHIRYDRPQNSRRAAIRRPHHHAATRRQGRAVGLALPPPGQVAGGARRDHALYRNRRPEIAWTACQRVHLDQAGAAEGGRPQPVRQGDLEMG